MVTRKVGALRLAEASGVAKSAIANWKGGGNLPRVETAARLADVLHWPALERISRDGRTLTCARCERPFVNNGGAPAKFCTPTCRDIDAQLRAPHAGTELARRLRDTLAERENVRGGIPKDAIATALTDYARSDSRRVKRQDLALRQVDGLQSLIDSMCRSCEPDGLCRTPECPLRPASLHPLVTTEAGDLRPVEGPWGPRNREKQLVAIREANAERWSRPGERERFADDTRARIAAMSPEERIERGRRISAGRRGLVA